MRCQFCGTSTNKLFTGPKDIVLCEQCYEVYKKGLPTEDTTEETKTQVQETQVQENEVVEQNAQTNHAQDISDQIRCQIVLGVLNDGRLFFNVYGPGADLLVVEGLLKYAERRLQQQWDLRDREIAAQRAVANSNQDEGA